MTTDFSTWTRKNLEDVATEMQEKLHEPEIPTLRDMFAMFARPMKMVFTAEDIARDKYEVADAMMQERKK